MGIGIIVLGKFAGTSGIGTDAATAINATGLAIGDFADWMPLVVIIIIAAVIIGLVMMSFGNKQ